MKAWVIFDKATGAVINVVVNDTAPPFDATTQGRLRINDHETIKKRDLSQAVVRGGRLDFRI